MKKLFVPLAIVAMIFTSCKKYDASEPLDLESLPKVTLTGTVYAQLDETVPTMQFAPEGTVVRVSIPYANYDLNNASNGRYVKTTTINAQGGYSIEVPVVSTGVNATVSFKDFTYSVKQQNAVGQSETILKHFACADQVVANLGKGKNEGDYINIDATYGSNAVNPNDSTVLAPTTTVTVSGKLDYLSDDTTYRSVPEGTAITAVIKLTAPDNREYNQTQTITVGAAGTYSIKVPMVTRGEASVKLMAENFWEYTDLTTNKRAIYRYTLSQTIGGIYNYANQTGKDYHYLQGTKVNDVQ